MSVDSWAGQGQRGPRDRAGVCGSLRRIALSYVTLYSIFLSEREFLERAVHASDRALAIDPEQIEARVARGRILFTPAQGYPLERAAAEHERVLAQNPSSVEARFHLGQVYFHMGLLDESIAQSREPAALNPLDFRPRSSIGLALMYQLRADEALAAFRSLPDDYNLPTRAPHMAWALLLLGRLPEAEAVLENALAQQPKDRAGTIASMQAILAAARGDSATALQKIRIAETKERRSILFHHTSYNIGKAYALLGRRDDAIAWLRASAEDGLPLYSLFARDPHLESVRDDPPFTALLEDLRVQFERYRTRSQPPLVTTR